MTNKDLILEFIEGTRAAKGNAANHLIYKDNSLWNYSTLMVIIDREQHKAWVNAHKYSVTTSKIQTIIRQELDQRSFEIIDFDGKPCDFYWNAGYCGAKRWTVKDLQTF